eukprot:3142703-Rhodomonas_salina.6
MLLPGGATRQRFFCIPRYPPTRTDIAYAVLSAYATTMRCPVRCPLSPYGMSGTDMRCATTSVPAATYLHDTGCSKDRSYQIGKSTACTVSGTNSTCVRCYAFAVRYLVQCYARSPAGCTVLSGTDGGYAAARLFVRGKWRLITIDDRLPGISYPIYLRDYYAISAKLLPAPMCGTETGYAATSRRGSKSGVFGVQ